VASGTNKDGSGTEVAIRRFGRYFKAYALGLSLVTASFPPVIGFFDVMPIFASIKAYVTGLTSLSCYLLVGFLFSVRRNLGQMYYPERKEGSVWIANRRDAIWARVVSVLPSVLIVASLVFFFLYLWTIHNAIHRIAYEYAEQVVDNDAKKLLQQVIGPQSDLRGFVVGRLEHQDAIVRIAYELSPSTKAVSAYDVQFPTEGIVRSILQDTPSASLPSLFPIALFFISAFLCAVAAFVLVGLKDYLQDVLGISERELLTRTILVSKGR
jgi:hypothetical protein